MQRTPFHIGKEYFLMRDFPTLVRDVIVGSNWLVVKFMDALIMVVMIYPANTVASNIQVVVKHYYILH